MAEEYFNIIKLLTKYIEKVKIVDKDIPLIDIIMDFSIKRGIELELIGDIISTDSQFKACVERDCQVHKIFKSEINNENW